VLGQAAIPALQVGSTGVSLHADSGVAVGLGNKHVPLTLITMALYWICVQDSGIIANMYSSKALSTLGTTAPSGTAGALAYVQLRR
jgi:hypothetical protein